MSKQSSSKIAFEFNNQISPIYVEPLLLQLESNRWYGSDELQEMLWNSGSRARGDDIVRHNMVAWSLIGFGSSKVTIRDSKRRRIVRLTATGKQVAEIYSTNRDLFFDLMHYFFYSAWYRSQDLQRVRFWLYSSVCNLLWIEAPALVDTNKITNRLQTDANQSFPDYKPAFPKQSVKGVFPWLAALSPAFLERPNKIGEAYNSVRRNFCTPQLFHLATNLVYNSEQLSYGTSMALSEKHIEDICKVCLLDPAKFWSVADLTAMMIREFSVQRGQWGRSIVLSGSPTWIDLPDFSVVNETDSEEVEEEAEETTAVKRVEDSDEGEDDEGGELWI